MSRSVNKSELIYKVQERNPEMYCKDIDKVLSSLQDIIMDELQSGNRVKLMKLVLMEPVTKSAGYHYDGIKTKTMVKVPKRVHVKYKSLKLIKDMEEDSRDDE